MTLARSAVSLSSAELASTYSASGQRADDVGLLNRLVVAEVLVVLVIAVLLVVVKLVLLLVILLDGVSVGGLALLGRKLEALLLVELKLVLILVIIIDVDVAVELRVRVRVVTKVRRQGVVRDLDDGSTVGVSQLLAESGVGNGEVVSDVDGDLLTCALAQFGRVPPTAYPEQG